MKKLITCILSLSLSFSVVAPTLLASAQVIDTTQSERQLSGFELEMLEKYYSGEFDNDSTERIALTAGAAAAIAFLKWFGKAAIIKIAVDKIRINGLGFMCKHLNDSDPVIDAV